MRNLAPAAIVAILASAGIGALVQNNMNKGFEALTLERPPIVVFSVRAAIQEHFDKPMSQLTQDEMFEGLRVVDEKTKSLSDSGYIVLDSTQVMAAPGALYYPSEFAGEAQ
jgi:hypothetical protein